LFFDFLKASEHDLEHDLNAGDIDIEVYGDIFRRYYSAGTGKFSEIV